MSCEAITYVWTLKDIDAEERLALLWIANASAGLGYPVCPEWIGMGEFMCCGYQRASSVLCKLSDKGLVHWGQEEDAHHCVWIVYGGPLFPPVDWCKETKSRSKRVAALIERDGPDCSYCGHIPVNYEVDHFIPKAKGGPDRMDNLVLACSPCNRAKRDKHPQDFLRGDPARYALLHNNLAAYGGE